jgi:peptide/nickel transport system permease protein
MSFTVSKLVAQRILLGLVLLLANSILVFIGTQILPGDVAQSILGQSATPEALDNLRQAMGLYDPGYLRYLHWLGGVLRGDLGVSLSSGQDIATVIAGRLANTLFLAACAATVAVPLSIFLGLLAVRFRNGVIDRAISGVALVSASLPEFFVAYVLIMVFAVRLRFFPSISPINSDMPLLQRLQMVALPAAVLVLVVLPPMMRMTRAAILNVMQSPYIETAELKGLSAFKIIYRHAFPNAISPVVNVVTLNLAYLVVGVVVIEVIFVYPGIGQYLVDHVSKRDVPVVQAVCLVFAAVYLSLNVVADVVSILSNPRLRHGR